MHHLSPPPVLPMRDGVGPSCIALPATGQGSMLDFLDSHLSEVGRSEWLRRIEAGEVVDERGLRVTADRPFERSLRLYYYRCLPTEPVIPFDEVVLYQDEHLLVADKPHFLPVTPSGRYLQQTLLVRLKKRLNLPDLVPLHRIDRDTAGLVLFSVQRATRGRYHAMFHDQTITKHYEAVAPWHAGVTFPREHRSRLEESPQFFRMHEVPGQPNTCTQMSVLEIAAGWARYRLSPITGKRHQLRLHMAALGLPLRHDALYPQVNNAPEGDFSQPLQLLAKSLAFTDPLSGKALHFESQRSLRPLPCA